MRSITIGDTVVADQNPAYLIAELGSNHQGDVETAKRMVRAAAGVGASAVKLQKRDNRALYTRAFYDAPYGGPHAFGATYGEHREALEFTVEQHRELRAEAARCGVDYIVTPFDEQSVHDLAEIGVAAVKIASGDMTNEPLVTLAAQVVGTPIIISTGGWDMGQVERAARRYEQLGVPVAMLQCTAAYPCAFDHAALSVIPMYRAMLPFVIGYSGHEPGWGIVPAAYALGARIIEKHFTMDHSWKGGDQAFSLTPAEFRQMAQALKATWAATGPHRKVPLAVEDSAMHKLGKGLYAARALPTGTVLTVEDIAIKSPRGPLQPWDIGLLIGQTLAEPMAAEQAFGVEVSA